MGSITKFRPKNTGVFEAGAHEMTHILEDWLAYKHNGTYQELASKKFARQILRNAFTCAQKLVECRKKDILTMCSEISSYAKKNVSECMAEAVADWFANGEQSAILSKEIWKALKKELEK